MARRAQGKIILTVLSRIDSLVRSFQLTAQNVIVLNTQRASALATQLDGQEVVSLFAFLSSSVFQSS